MKRLLIGAVLLLIGASLPAYAQSPVVTQPKRVTTQNYSSTVAVTNTFQSVWAANASRYACTIQNNGSNTMYVYFGAMASATSANSVRLAAGQSVQCNVEGLVLQDQVSITGTSGEAFYAAQQ